MMFERQMLSVSKKFIRCNADVLVRFGFYFDANVVVNFMSYDMDFTYSTKCHIRPSKPYSDILCLPYPERVILREMDRTRKPSATPVRCALFVTPTKVPSFHSYQRCESHEL